MKRRIRLTESDLHRIIKESVNKVLNEDYEFGYNEYGEPGYYIGNYPTYDDRIQDAAESILDGDLDDMIWDKDWYKDMIRKDEPMITQAIKDRRCYLDKNYAMNHGDERNDNIYNNKDKMSIYRKFDRVPREKIFKSIDEEEKIKKEKLYKMLDRIEKKYGSLNNAPKQINKQIWTIFDQLLDYPYYDSKYKHSKNSLNRKLISMDKKRNKNQQ